MNRHWPGFAPAGALLSCLCKKVSKEAQPTIASPVGDAQPPNPGRGVLRQLALRAQTAKPVFPPPGLVDWRDRGHSGRANPVRSVARPSEPTPGSSVQIRKELQPGTPQSLCHAESSGCPAEKVTSLSEPAGRVGEARRRRGLAIGYRRQATRPWAVLLCLLSCTSKKVRRPPGRDPANDGHTQTHQNRVSTTATAAPSPARPLHPVWRAHPDPPARRRGHRPIRATADCH